MRGSARQRLLLLLLLTAEPTLAEILSANTPLIRLRLGDNVRGSTNTVVYDAGIPATMGGLAGVTAAPLAVSSTSVPGGSGVYRVRLVTDLNAFGSIGRLEGRFSFDSSVPMSCVTPATCGASTISFQRISWTTRDSDTHTAVTRFDGTASQLAQVQIDSNPARNQTDTRHRNYLQYAFDNVELLPAGTYEGSITLNGSGTF
ncbi:MAG: hypothetical protein AAGG11_12920 [Pseudomonadota bacterium]